MTDVCFTILHYLSAEVTMRCADSLLALSGIEKCRIIVLDNGSPNDSFEALRAKYEGQPLVELHKGEANLGFTGGNNFLYARAKEYAPRCVVVLNNDTVIEQKDFIPVLLKTEEESGAYVLGVDVYAPYAHVHQNPLYSSLPSIQTLDGEMEAWRRIIKDGGVPDREETAYKLQILRHKLLPQGVVELFRKVRGTTQEEYKKDVKDPVIQGSCIIATRKYMDLEDVLFEPNTGFYFEEMLLALKCRTKGYPTLYTPELQLIHHHAVASRMASGKYSDYMLTQAKRMISAFEIYRSTYNNNPWVK